VVRLGAVSGRPIRPLVRIERESCGVVGLRLLSSLLPGRVWVTPRRGEELVRRRDDLGTLRGGGGQLLARVRAAASLDQPTQGRNSNLVSAADREIEALECLQGRTSSPRSGAARSVSAR